LGGEPNQRGKKNKERIQNPTGCWVEKERGKSIKRGAFDPAGSGSSEGN